MRRAKFGDTYAMEGIDTSTYAEYISNHPFLGHIIRIWKCETDPKKAESARKPLFIVGFPVSAAVRDGFFALMESAPGKKDAENHIFKYPNRNLKTKEIASWTIMTPGKSTITKSLNDDQKKMPLAYIVNATKLVEMIHQKWDGLTPLD